MSAEDYSLILGALDSAGVALAAHGHVWSVGEREIYEQAVGLLTKALQQEEEP